MNIKNPFSDFGKIVQGDRFIGRSKEITQIHNRLLGKNYGNLAIIGLPRIGKSSLAFNALFIQAEILLKDKTIVLWINTGKIPTSKSFFEKLVFDVTTEIEIHFPELYSNLEKIYNKIKESDLSNIEFNSFIQRFFEMLNKHMFKIVFILDEFDNSKRIFGVEDFQLLRELSYSPLTQVALVTISRRTLQELEPLNGYLSNFYQIFSEIHLGFFSGSDLLKYWDFARKHNVTIDKNSIDTIMNFTSSHPFLLDVVNNDIFNNLNNNSISFNETLKSILSDLNLKIRNEYNSIINLLKEEKLLSKAIQIIVGPVYDVKQIDVDKLLKYQLIKSTESGYNGFCNFFNDYLSLIQKEVDVWPLWSQTESEIRKLIKEFLNTTYGINWEDKFLKDGNNSKKINYVMEYKKLRDKSIRSFKERASQHLVDYTYPSDMMDCFISSNWNHFSTIFKKTLAEWSPIFSHLSKIRNPLAHNNSSFLSESDKNKAIGYCQEILSLIENRS